MSTHRQLSSDILIRLAPELEMEEGEIVWTMQMELIVNTGLFVSVNDAE